MLTTSSFAQTFVKQDATGAGDGSSWTNAYTSLNVALTSITSGDVWVASGTYIPNEVVSDSSATFRILNDISLYGGFNGSETNLADRDIAANPTILSGDLNGNDIADDFDANKEDNAQHVLVVDSLLNPITIDGFNISGGHTSNLNDQDDFFYRGGGIFSYSTVTVRNCTFSQNFSRGGAGIYISPGANGGDNSIIEDCNFSNNLTTSQSAGILLIGLSDVDITNCVFENNQTVRGAIYPRFCTNVNVDGCTFNSNIAVFTDGFGGVLFNWQSIGFNISNSTFSNNRAGNGGVIYNDARNIEVGVVSLALDNCTFIDNQATNFGGGAIYVWRSSYTIDDCTFTRNLGTNGSHIFNSGDDKEIAIRNSQFTGGSGNFGGAVNCYGGNSNFVIEGSTFTENQASTSGGAIIVGFGADVTIDSCNFSLNQAEFGGAINVQNEGVNLSIVNTVFDANGGTNFGGAVNYSAAGDLTIDNCDFFNNSSNRGGALSISELSDTIVPLSFMLTNSVFNFNTAEEQGAALNMNNAGGTLFNNVFMNNFNPNGVAGGALSLNTGDSLSYTINLVNSSFSNNIASVGSGIAAFTTELESELIINIQNTILSNSVGNDIEVEDGTPTIVSLGGNLSSDASAIDIFTDATDQNEVPNMFFVSPTLDLRLQAESPAINAGISMGAPVLDLDGNARVEEVDAGAYEFQVPVGTENLIKNNGQLKVFPNPVSTSLNFEIKTDWVGELQIKVFNIQGQELRNWKTNKTGETLEQTINVNNLARGVYDILISNGTSSVVERFIKI